jgi:MFS family permease
LSSLLTGRLLYRAQANDILAIAVLFSTLSPLLMAIMNATSPYWTSAVFAISLTPIASNAVIPIASMMVANTFPLETQGLAMGVLCTVAMIGASVGLALTALVSNDVATHLQQIPARNGAFEFPEIWMSGCRSAFWFLFSLSLVALLVTLGCLRKLGYLGRMLDSEHS